MTDLTQDQWITKIQGDNNSVIIDVRTPEECFEGIQESALMINILQLDTFMQEINKLDKTKTYYLYCRSGNRSGRACRILEDLGFNETYNLIGGMNSWTEKTVNPSKN